jgi:phosphatidate cytidylyltransferase
LYEVFSVNLRRGFVKIRLLTIGLSLVIYFLLAFGLLRFSLTSSSDTIIFAYLVVAAFDGFSQVIGQLIGKHQLASRISPGKTLEGTFGGLFAAIIAALLLRSLPHISVSEAVIVGSLLGVAGLGGDLLASWCKRINGVKDFGYILPGHGGVLDRFDSLFAAGTVFWIYAVYTV